MDDVAEIVIQYCLNVFYCMAIVEKLFILNHELKADHCPQFDEASKIRNFRLICHNNKVAKQDSTVT